MAGLACGGVPGPEPGEEAKGLSYLAEVERILRAGGCSGWPSTLISQWQGFIEGCEEGYRWDVSEYDNEMSARRELELLLSSSALQGFAEIRDLADVVAKLDERFRALLQETVERPERSSWFEKGILKRAGSEYADFFRSAYGVEVEIVE